MPFLSARFFPYRIQTSVPIYCLDNRQKKRGSPPAKVGLPLSMNKALPSCPCRTAMPYPQNYDTFKCPWLQAEKYDPFCQGPVPAVLGTVPPVSFSLPLLRCNAALCSRRKKHFNFDSINTITALSFCWPHTAVNETVQSNRNLPAWIVCTIMLPAACGPNIRESPRTGFGIVWKIFQAEQRGSGTSVPLSYTMVKKPAAYTDVCGRFLPFLRIVPCFETHQKTGI